MICILIPPLFSLKLRFWYGTKDHSSLITSVKFQMNKMFYCDVMVNNAPKKLENVVTAIFIYVVFYGPYTVV